MPALARFQLDMSSDELDSIERWSSMAGIRTKKEFLLNAITLFKWAAQQILLGRTICAVNESTGEIRHLEMPALTAIAEYGAPPVVTPQERRRLIAEPAHPLPKDYFRTGEERDVEADRSLDTRRKGGSRSNLDKKPAAPPRTRRHSSQA
jgi:hypothetical protein